MPREFALESIGRQSSRNHAPLNRRWETLAYLEEQQERMERRAMQRAKAPRKMPRLEFCRAW